MAATEFTVARDALQVVMTRVFDAPRDVLFKVYTDPALYPKWWGPGNLETTVEKMENRVGGEWHVTQVDPDGNKFVFYGVCREFSPPERLVATFEYEPWAGHVSINTATFEDLGGKTRLTVISQFDSIDDLEGMVQSGMESGATEGWERLAELLTTV
jgi:uncharacterized protein YndB with AHSA1/START domain